VKKLMIRSIASDICSIKRPMASFAASLSGVSASGKHRVDEHYKATRVGTKEHAALTARICKETDAFRATLDRDDPTKF